MRTDNDVMEFCKCGQFNKVVQVYCTFLQDSYDDLPDHVAHARDKLAARVADDMNEIASGVLETAII